MRKVEGQQSSTDGNSSAVEPDSPIGARRTEKLSEVLAREIVRDLRTLTPSTMLPSESIMLRKYRVGRASLREALRLLEVQGLIVIRPGPGGGPMVAQADSAHYGKISSLYYHMLGATYQDVLDARMVIEPMVARLVAERQDPDDMSMLQEYLDRLSQSPSGDYERYVEDASEFHSMLVSMSGNPVLSLSARSLQDVYLERVHGLFPPERQKQVERDHRAVVQAMINGEATRAERVMRKHMAEYDEYSKKRYPGMLSETVDWH